MKGALLCVLLVVPLAACGGGSGARKALAACELQKGAKDDYGGWDLTYLETCMQAKGFVMDNNLTMDGGHLCEFHSAPWTEAACYRPDDPVAKIVAKEIYR